MEANNALVAAPQSGIDFANPKSFETMQRACKYLVSSDLVPASYSAAKVGEDKAIANTLIALDMSSRTSANPLMIMQNLYVVQGRPSFSSAFLVATINSCGRYETLRYKKGVIDGGVRGKNGQIIPNLPNMYCYAYTWERGQKFFSEEDKKDSCLISTKITMQMAVDEGWYDKPGSKWKTMPSQMLMYRAAAFWCRAFAPELSMGMHTTEEVKDGFVSEEDDDDDVDSWYGVDYDEVDTKEETKPKKQTARSIMQSVAAKINDKKAEPTDAHASEEEDNIVLTND